MIRFFRQIRQRLLTENRFTKYLLYAIGEIILVVIGILIALQINNWNEEQRSKRQADVFREKLVQDVIQDTLKINEILEDRKRIQKNIKDYFEYFDSGQHTPETLIDSARSVKWSLFRYLPQNYTFRDMQATGNTSLLMEKEREGLIDLANTQDFLIQIIEKQIDEILEELHKRDAYLGDHMSETDFFETLNAPLNPAESRKGLLHQHNAFTEIVELGDIMEAFAISIKQKSKNLILLLKQN
ncbi:DUF6090 family protein [Lentiprolixibacter aurantiacus]|uniref:DUF6090 family protein n=1 Tax=Lentiprolixibacter aurantiacus TaxID=2993939 RepID=A0AAE3SMC7_9FLAO|nr:DUF6090 family protein [Lentiprolixibacter aurantiacus]MCX2718439.1 DUF6090 family protein [Lentiprolixibacter aurantiacus]